MLERGRLVRIPVHKDNLRFHPNSIGTGSFRGLFHVTVFGFVFVSRVR